MARLHPLWPFLGIIAGGIAAILIAKVTGIVLVAIASSWGGAAPAPRTLTLFFSVALAITSCTAFVAGMTSAWIGKRFESVCGALASWASVLSIVGTSRSVSTGGVSLATPLIVGCMLFCPLFGILGAQTVLRVRSGRAKEARS